MRRLLLLRHAKSDWQTGSLGDHDRPLASRGRRAARTIGRFLNATGRIPDFLVSSSARRARRTAELAADAGSWGLSATQIHITKRLYLTTAPRLIDVIHQQDDAVETLMLVGHEPSWSHLLSVLVGGGQHRFPTAALASIRFDDEHWTATTAGSGMLEWLVTPKLLARFEDRKAAPDQRPP